MSRQCRELDALLGRSRSSSSDAERLLLERHLTECAVCRRASELSQTVATMIREAPSELSARGRERALSAAFDRALAPAGIRQPPARAWRIACAVAAAAVLALGLKLTLERPAATLATHAVPGTPLEASAPPAQLAATSTAPTTVSDSTQKADQDSPWIEVDERSTREFAHATVELEPGTRCRFLSDTTTLELARGRVSLDVDARRGRPFDVLTQSFRVQVLGTQFAVSLDRVDVRRGHVRIVDHASRTLADLRSGGSFVFGEPPSGTRAPASAGERARPSTATLLERARNELSGGHVGVVRELLVRARAGSPSRGDQAEIGTLSAECSLVERRPAEAIREYLRVARRYEDLTAGENALFAAAQLSAREPDQGGARPLLERYLHHYPAGRFADEARARLAARHR